MTSLGSSYSHPLFLKKFFIIEFMVLRKSTFGARITQGKKAQHFFTRASFPFPDNDVNINEITSLFGKNIVFYSIIFSCNGK